METKNNSFNTLVKAREELIHSIILVSKKIITYSLLEEITDIQGVFCFSEEYLSGMNDEKLLTEASALVEYIKLQKIDLDCFGIEQPSLDILIYAIEQYKLCIENAALDIQIELNKAHSELG